GSLTGNLNGTTASFTGNLIEIGGSTLPALALATVASGSNSNAADLVASAFNSTTGTPKNQTFRWQSEPIGNNTGTPSGSLNLLFGSNGATPGETGLQIASNCAITFSAGQVFPGSVTSVTAGDGSIAIAGSAAAPTVAVATGGITNAKLASASLGLAAGGGISVAGSNTLGGATTVSNTGILG